MENLIYALIQAGHNLGAVAVVAAPMGALWSLSNMFSHAIRKLIIVGFSGWCLQFVSGIGFGMSSYSFYGEVPQLDGVAYVALVLKLCCAVVSSLAYLYFILKPKSPGTEKISNWIIFLVLATVALMSAAFLRWYA